ncbi:MAG: mannose-6-phosphate isomerase, class I [Desulfobacterales bacterium]|nr:mannose-6-phosphate isomerase, class I [Desulfobacterales bacterium]MDX2508491.1 mannose-6-phosphate isomerase, class I [Desulfobacterales bacterium]
MKTICLLENTVQEYAWGSYTAIAELLDESSPSDVPQAELWMGAHPKAPSMVRCDGAMISLQNIIKDQPKDILGETIAEKFNNKLPYLLKVLAAVRPLSIQAHPNLVQAKEGFKRENEQEISIDAPNRNYKDANHKPECICALTPFWALNGFRKINYILSFMEKLCPNSLGKELNELGKKHNTDGLKQFFKVLMTLDQKGKKQVLSETINNAHKFTKLDSVFEWIIKLSEEYPGDTGVLSPAFLNLICLKPGQAMFLFAGELHAYLDGLGIELMANSDNVLRGGLTPKHVDVPELLKVVNFEERDIKILECEKNKVAECIYESMAEEFILSVISVDSKNNYTSPAVRSAEILLCTDGQATITDFSDNENISLKKGKSVIVPASVRMYNIKGSAKIYKASVNNLISS